MFWLHSSADITFILELSNLALHSSPPISLLEVLIHLRAPRVDGEERILSLVHDYFTKVTFWHNNTILEEESMLVIKAVALVLGLTLGNPNLHLLHHSVKKPSLANLIFQGRRDLKVGEETLRNNLQVKFAESFTKLGLIRLEKQTIAIRFPAQSVSNHIGLAWSILNTRIILLNHFDPSSQPEVEIKLSEDVLETLVVSEDVHFSSQ